MKLKLKMEMKLKINKLVGERRKKENKRGREKADVFPFIPFSAWAVAGAGETGINLLEHPSQIAALIDHSR